MNGHSPAAGASQVRICLAIYLLFLSIYLALTSGHVYSLDHTQVFQTTEALVERGNWEIEPEANAIIKEDGTAYASYGPLQSVLSVPLYLVGRTIDENAAQGTRAFFAGEMVWEGRYGGTVELFFVALFNQLLTPLLCVVFYLTVLQFGFSRRTAFLMTLVLGLTTIVGIGAHEFYQHQLECLLLLSTAYVLISHRQDLGARHVLVAGTLLGLASLTRVNTIVLLPSFCLYIAWLRVAAVTPDLASVARTPIEAARTRLLAYLRRLSPSEARYVLALAVPLLVTAGVWLWFNQVRFGSLWGYPENLEAGIVRAAIPDALHGFLLSSGRGFFIYSPVCLLALFVYRRFLSDHPAEALLFGSAAIIYVCFYSTYLGWYGGPSWGPRYLLAMVPFVLLPAAYFIEGGGWGARLLAAVALLGGLMQIPGTVVNVAYSFEDVRPLVSDFPESVLFVPRFSPLYRQMLDLLHWHNVDLWLVWVYENYGLRTTLLTLCIPIVTLVTSLWLLASSRLAASVARPVTPAPTGMVGGTAHALADD